MEHAVIDMLIDVGTRKAGEVDKATVHSLYTKGLIYLDVPVYDEDFIISTLSCSRSCAQQSADLTLTHRGVHNNY
jgi:hypothetical protein